MIFIVMLYPVIDIKHPTIATHKTLNFYSTTSLNKDAHHAARGRYRTFSAPCSTGEKEGHEHLLGINAREMALLPKTTTAAVIHAA